MRIGLFSATIGDARHDIDSVVKLAREAEERGFDTLWLPNAFGLDAVGACAVAGWETDHIELGTAVTPTYPRHPAALAQQALTTQAACGGRFTLGIGLSHKIVIEDMFGLSYAKPAHHMREYLRILAPLLRGEPADYDGETMTGRLTLEMPGTPSVPLLLAALGPAMLELAGAHSHGTTTWMVGPRTLEKHIVPKINAAASAAGHPAPRVVCGLPICLTSDPDPAREQIARELKIYGMLPSYQAMLEKEGVKGPADLAIVGDENVIRAGIARVRDAGATDLNAAVMVAGNERIEQALDLLQSELA